MTPDGVGDVHDFMPVITGEPTDRHRPVQVMRVPRGTMRCTLDLQPRFDYGRQQHKLTVSKHGAVFEADGGHLTLYTVEAQGSSSGSLASVEARRHGDGLRATWTLREG